MDKVIPLKNSRYKFTVEIRFIDEWIKFHSKAAERKELAIICIKDQVTDCTIVHPITEFVLKWSSRQLNTKKRYAYTVVSFLNYLLDNKNDLKINSLTEIDFSHGTKFLNHLAVKGNAYETITSTERMLIKLYLFLSQEIPMYNTGGSNSLVPGGKYPRDSFINSPFKPIYPAVEPKNVEHLIPFQYIPVFLEIAVTESHPIALGIYMQIFGGLRVGEVCNITHNRLRRLPFGDIVVDLKNQYFRRDLREGNASVKRVRPQRIMNIHGLLKHLYDDHIELYKPKNIENKRNIPLFINRDGNAISLGSYRQYFNKTKTRFINHLITSGQRDAIIWANHLRNEKWSTHIGRGTFTNLLSEFADNPYDVAYPRGDKVLLLMHNVR
jgi:hypothetical protein